MRILSPQRLPFRHPGMLSVSRILPRISVSLKTPVILDQYVDAWKMRDYPAFRSKLDELSELEILSIGYLSRLRSDHSRHYSLKIHLSVAMLGR